jgi:hypothetical protein
VIYWITGRKRTNSFAACMVAMALTESSRVDVTRYSFLFRSVLSDAIASLSRFRDLCDTQGSCGLHHTLLGKWWGAQNRGVMVRVRVRGD